MASIVTYNNYNTLLNFSYEFLGTKTYNSIESEFLLTFRVSSTIINSNSVSLSIFNRKMSSVSINNTNSISCLYFVKKMFGGSISNTNTVSCLYFVKKTLGSTLNSINTVSCYTSNKKIINVNVNNISSTSCYYFVIKMFNVDIDNVSITSCSYFVRRYFDTEISNIHFMSAMLYTKMLTSSNLVASNNTLALVCKSVYFKNSLLSIEKYKFSYINNLKYSEVEDRVFDEILESSISCDTAQLKIAECNICSSNNITLNYKLDVNCSSSISNVSIIDVNTINKVFGNFNISNTSTINTIVNLIKNSNANITNNSLISVNTSNIKYSAIDITNTSSIIINVLVKQSTECYIISTNNVITNTINNIFVNNNKIINFVSQDIIDVNVETKKNTNCTINNNSILNVDTTNILNANININSLSNFDVNIKNLKVIDSMLMCFSECNINETYKKLFIKQTYYALDVNSYNKLNSLTYGEIEDIIFNEMSKANIECNTIQLKQTTCNIDNTSNVETNVQTNMYCSSNMFINSNIICNFINEEMIQSTLQTVSDIYTNFELIINKNIDITNNCSISIIVENKEYCSSNIINDSSVACIPSTNKITKCDIESTSDITTNIINYLFIINNYGFIESRLYEELLNDSYFDIENKVIDIIGNANVDVNSETKKFINCTLTNNSDINIYLINTLSTNADISTVSNLTSNVIKVLQTNSIIKTLNNVYVIEYYKKIFIKKTYDGLYFNSYEELGLLTYREIEEEAVTIKAHCEVDTNVKKYVYIDNINIDCSNTTIIDINKFNVLESNIVINSSVGALINCNKYTNSNIMCCSNISSNFKLYHGKPKTVKFEVVINKIFYCEVRI